MNPHNNSHKTSPFIWIGIFLPILFFVTMLLTYAVNVPWFDDIDVLPDFLGKFLAATHWGERAWLLFKPNNEHRVVYAKLMNLLHYALTGTLNMRTLTLMGNLTLIGILWIFWRVIKEQKLSPLYYLPIPWLLLHPQYYLTSLWTITGFQYQPVIFFGLLGMYLLSRNTVKTFIFAILAVLFDSFTMSNGMFYWVAGIIILWLQGRYKLSGIWAICTLLVIKIYFYKFDTQANDQGFAYFFAHPQESFFGLFTHLGGSFDFQTLSPIVSRSIIPTIAGFILVAITVWWTLGFVVFSEQKPFRWFRWSNTNFLAKLNENLKAEPTNLVILGGFIFLLINALIIAILRPRFGYFVLIVGNYKVYPATFLVITYLMFLTGWLKFQHNKRVFYYILVGSILLNIFSYLKFLPEVHERRKDLLVRAYNQEYNHIGLGPQVGSAFDLYVQEALGRLTPTGIYTFPNSFCTQAQPLLSLPLSTNTLIKAQLLKRSEGIIITNNTLKSGLGINDGSFLVLKSAKRTYLVYEKRVLQNLTQDGFSIKIPEKFVIPDTYQLGILWLNGTQKQVFNTDLSLRIDF